jgi:hypothetical protein
MAEGSLSENLKAFMDYKVDAGDITSFENSESARILGRFSFWIEYNSVAYTQEDDQFKDCVGCFSYELPESSAAEGQGQCVYFMDNWVTTYNCLLVHAQVDEFGDKAPLFRAATDFYFNKYIMLLTTILTIYVVVLRLEQMRMDPTTKAAYGVPIFFHISCLIYSIWGRVLYKGHVASHRTIHKDDHGHHKHFNVHRDEPSLLEAIAVFGKTLREYMTSHIGKMFDATDEGGEENDVGGYGTIEDADNPELVDVDSNPLMKLPTEARAFLETGFHPVESGFYETLNAAVKYIVNATPYHKNDSNSGRGFEFRFMSRLVLVLSLVIIMFVELVVFVVGIFTEIFDKDDCGTYCNAQNMFFNYTAGGLVVFIQGCLLFTTVGTIYSGLFLASDTADALCKSWMKRFSGLRRLPAVADIPNHDASGDKNDMSVKLKDLLRLEPSVRRDAYERYLYMRHFMNAASKEWSPLLVLIFAFTLCACLICYVLLQDMPLTYYHRSVPLLGGLAAEFVLLIWPLYCLAYSNIRVDQIRETFYNCAPGDFASIGGVTEWTAFMTANSLYWNVMGIPITIEVMQSWFSYLIGFLPFILVVLKSVMGKA